MADKETPNDSNQLAVVRLVVELDPRINFALQQNDVPVIKGVRIENPTPDTLSDVRLEIRSEPAFTSVWTRQLDSIQSGAEYCLRDVDLLLSPEFLALLTEMMRGVLHVSLTKGESLIASLSLPVELLAYDQWSGLQSLPEILAAFVLPNHPGIDSTLLRASEVLRLNSGDGALSGYQTQSRERVVRTVEAIYLALAEQDIRYTSPPASFEQSGQKVRTPDRILESKLATCLDLAVLAAACFEQAGLHALVVVIQGHAFAGVWLDDECFAHSTEDDPIKLRKRVDLNEIIVFETTHITGSPSPEFAKSVLEGRRHLDNADEFLCVIDIHRARKSGIRPLPLRSEGGRTVVAQTDNPDSAAPLTPSSMAIVEKTSEDKTADTPQTRLDMWRRKLLDLTLHNRLLNYKDNRKALPIICPDLAALEDSLSDGAVFQLRARPGEFSAADPRDADAFRRRTGDEGLKRVVLEELKAKRLCGDVTQEELDRRLIELFRAARMSIEEGGASALYLAVGFIRWYETNKSEKALLAPILLVPIEIERKSIQHGFRLFRGADDTRVNTTLMERLRSDFGLTVSGMDPLPQDDSGVDVAAVLRRFREAVKDVDRWEVIDAAAIGFFSFAKFLMWRDLQERADDLMNSPVVRHLVQRDGTRFDPDFHSTAPERLDEVHSPKDCFTPLDADSSQLWSVLCAAQGRTFVLWGPPGTGKSQTITNMIAHTLATGKTVLFVSEKSAALNVVYSRLKRLGLERFCLELHSNKARKHDVIQQLGDVLNVVESRESHDWERKADQLAQLRNQLNALVDALHRRRTNGLTVFHATSQLVGLKHAIRVPLQWGNPNAHTQDALESLRDNVDALKALASRLGPLAQHPWHFLSRSEWSFQWQETIQTSVIDALTKTHAFCPALKESARILGLQDAELTRRRIETLLELAQYVLMRPPLPAAILEEDDWQDQVQRVREWTTRGKKRDQLRESVYAQFVDDALTHDFEGMLNDWRSIVDHSPIPGLAVDADAFVEQLAGWVALVEERERLRSSVFKVFKPEVLLSDVTGIAAVWHRLAKAGSLTRWFVRWKARRAVRPVLTSEVIADNVVAVAMGELKSLVETQHSIEGVGAAARTALGLIWREGEPEPERLRAVLAWAQRAAAVARRVNALARAERIAGENLLSSLEALAELQSQELQIAGLNHAAKELLGRYWNEGEPDWTRLAQAMHWAQSVRGSVEKLAQGDREKDAAQRARLAGLITIHRDSLRPEGANWKVLETFRTAWPAFTASEAQLAMTMEVPHQALPTSEESPTFIDDFTAMLVIFQGSYQRLREWCDWMSRKSECTNAGLGVLVQAYEEGRTGHEQLLDVFNRSYYEWWLGRITDSEEVLRKFSSIEHERLIGRFRDIDGEFLKLTKEIIAARLAANVPSTSASVVANSEMGILQHELRKKRRHTSVRSLVGKIPTLLPRLKPCLLMSPMSVAQYLDPAFPPFDIVIFDEASQIPVWDAVGALARGKQAVVVGDPKQLPPTNFFARADEDAEDVDETLQDLESVLDDCLGAQLPQLHLEWHYRSRHESLIHFSNHHYYENRLLTFPSPMPSGMGVQWRYVSEGVYGRSKDRTNRPEADRVVAEVVARLKDPKRRRASIGVVTFSVAQQALIEELLDVARREDSEIERFFSEDEVEEPVFIKNLENVQGDERDVIIFSICYGPDHTGIVSLNFGPINRTGGERRLNVAITRARRELLVFTSLRADMINLARTKAVGAAHLKTFLDYAERGPIALPSANSVHDTAECESPLEQEIHDALLRRGWRLHKQVGCSGYRIDLAVMHPEREGRYAIGIECDGANYHRARSARDRDRLRDSVLKDLGWRLERVWSTDWWTDSERELEKLDAAIRAAIDATKEPESEAPVVEGEEVSHHESGNFSELLRPSPEPLLARAYATPSLDTISKPTSVEIDLPRYTPTQVNRLFGTQADLDTPQARKRMPELLAQIAETEGPVAFTVACRRVAAHWGFQKATGRVQDVVRAQVPASGLLLADSGGVEFLWPAGIGPDVYNAFRVNGPDRETARNADEIPLEEFGNGMRYLLKTHFGMPAEDLKTATARLFGFSRSGSAVAGRIDLALQRQFVQGNLIEGNGSVKLGS
jgi:very-short-patch-repair endonuclease